MGRLDGGPAQIRVNGNYRGKPREDIRRQPDSGVTSNLLRLGSCCHRRDAR